uniref:Uncharacterized protein n=1 Tax=Aegilops tauschii subsp. strangulata TaxID=200361 RepID=A0A453QL33_AEGTS
CFSRYLVQQLIMNILFYSDVNVYTWEAVRFISKKEKEIHLT